MIIKITPPNRFARALMLSGMILLSGFYSSTAWSINNQVESNLPATDSSSSSQLIPYGFLTAMLAAQSPQHGLAKVSYRIRRAPLPTSGSVQRAPSSSFSLTTISSYLFRTACLLLQFLCARIGRRWIPIKMATLTFQMK